MWMVVLGVVLVVLKLAGLTAVSAWSWWWVLAPFAVAAVWWQIADLTGLTRRRAMQREDERAERRREKSFEALGLRLPKPGARRPPPQEPLDPRGDRARHDRPG